MCFWPIAHVELEDPPPPPKKKEEKKEEKPKPNYIMVSDQINLQPIAAPAAMHYSGQPHAQFYTSQPAAEPFNATYYPQPAASQGQRGGSNASAHSNPGPSKSNPPIQLVPQQPSPNQELWCRELDGNYTLRTVNTIMQDLQPGYWKRSVSGFPYWIRTTKT